MHASYSSATYTYLNLALNMSVTDDAATRPRISVTSSCGMVSSLETSLTLFLGDLVIIDR